MTSYDTIPALSTESLLCYGILMSRQALHVWLHMMKQSSKPDDFKLQTPSSSYLWAAAAVTAPPGRSGCGTGKSPEISSASGPSSSTSWWSRPPSRRRRLPTYLTKKKKLAMNWNELMCTRGGRGKLFFSLRRSSRGIQMSLCVLRLEWGGFCRLFCPAETLKDVAELFLCPGYDESFSKLEWVQRTRCDERTFSVWRTESKMNYPTHRQFRASLSNQPKWRRDFNAKSLSFLSFFLDVGSRPE